MTAPLTGTRPVAGAPSVRLREVSFRYGETVAVDRLNLEVAAGDVVALLGPNGAGKSTSISLLLGLLEPAAGTIELFGLRPAQAIRRGLVAAMLQENHLLPRATVGELLRFIHGRYERPMPIDDVLALADIGHLTRRTTEGLSGGQAQRVRFALAIVGAPALLVLDEPTAALDVEARRDFWTAIDAYALDGHAVLFSTHYLEEADEHAGRVVVIAAGRAIVDGTPEQIRATVPGRTVAFDVPSIDGPTIEELSHLPGVASVGIVGTRAQLRCTDSDATVGALADRRLLHNLEVTGGKLEDAFLSITHAAKVVTR